MCTLYSSLVVEHFHDVSRVMAVFKHQSQQQPQYVMKILLLKVRRGEREEKKEREMVN